MEDMSNAAEIWVRLGEGAIRKWTRLDNRLWELRTIGVSEATDEEKMGFIKRKVFGTVREMNKLEEAAGVHKTQWTRQGLGR